MCYLYKFMHRKKEEKSHFLKTVMDLSSGPIEQFVIAELVERGRKY